MSLAVRGLHFTYPGWPATLSGVDLDVARGEAVFLLGPSGSGKSTLLRCIAGLETDYRGAVTWTRRDGGLDVLDALPPERRRVGYLFQEPALFPHLDVWRNVAFGMRYREPSSRASQSRTAARRAEREASLEWLGLVGLAQRADDRVDELSGGQRQRVALARTLAARPRVVLLDEPFSSLDRDLRDELGPRVKELLHKQDVAALWVTHDADEARRLGDRVVRLVDGKLVPA